MSLSFELQAMGETKKALDEERKQLKKWKQSRDRFQNEIKSQIKIIEEEKKRYREKYHEALRYKAEFEKVDSDHTYSRLEVEKALNLYSLKNCEFKRARADYLVALEQFNMNRGQHYNHTLRQWGETGQEMEVYRIKKTQELLRVLAERLRVTIERMTSVCSDLEATAARLDAEKDSRALIERLRTGNLPPEDEPFEDLIIEDPPVINLESYGESLRRRTSVNNLTNTVVNTDDPEAATNGQSSPSTLVPSNDAASIVIQDSSSYTKYGTRGHRSSAIQTAPVSGPAARRLSTSSLGLSLGNGQVNGTGQSIMRKLFSRRSKRADSIDANCLPSSCNISRRNSLLFDYVKPWRRSHRSHSTHWRSQSFVCQDDEVFVAQDCLKKAFSVDPPSKDRRRKSTCRSSSPEDVQLSRSKSVMEPSMPANEQVELNTGALEKPAEKQYLFDNSDISDGTFDSTEHLIESAQDKDNQISAPPQTAVTLQSPVTTPSERESSLARHSQPVPISSTIQDDVVDSPVPLPGVRESPGLTACDSRLLLQEVQDAQELTSTGFLKPARPPPPTQMLAFGKNFNTSHRVLTSDNRMHERERLARYPNSDLTGSMGAKSRTSEVYSGPVPSRRCNRNSAEVTSPQQPKTDASQINHRTGRPQQQTRQGVHQPKRRPVERTATLNSNSPQEFQSEEAAKEMVVVGTCTALYDFTSEQFGESFLTFQKGDEFDVLASREQFPNSLDVEGWYYAERTRPAHNNPRFGFVPATFVQLNVFTEAMPLSRTSSELYRAHLSGTMVSNSNRSKQYDVLVSRQHQSYEHMALGQATEL
uniref:SH3 domain-containing protein n=2 Tax=Schistocephalus solidus TaxID=70667 RepID=A0A0V0J1F3_SCHSO